MKCIHILFSLTLLQFISIIVCSKLDEKYEEKLILTSYIKLGKLEEARNLSQVHLLGVNVESYSGYFNVNKTLNSNLFFWFFPTQSKQKSVPLLLWLQGGPGTSSLFGLFVENGPFFIDEELKLYNRNYSWTQNHSIIYIDSPIGSGFSFTESIDGYSKTQKEIVSNLYEALIQFFLLFPQFQSVDFFITGESYAGKYIPKLSLKIHDENQKNPLVNINYKGMAIGAGFSDPISMVDSYGDFYNNMGLINMDARKHFNEIGVQIKMLIQQGNYSHAIELQDELMGGGTYPSYFKNKTGYDFYYNVLETKLPPKHTYFIKFLKQKFIQQALHVENMTFINQNLIVPKVLRHDIFKSVKSTVQDLLNLKYQVLLYVGQFDMIVPHLAMTRFIESMTWNDKAAFENSERKIWVLEDGEIGGYVKKNQDLIYVILRKAGHNAPYDTPKFCFELISKFTRRLDLVE